MYKKGEKLILLPGRIEVTYIKSECCEYHLVQMPNGDTKKVFVNRIEKIKYAVPGKS